MYSTAQSHLQSGLFQRFLNGLLAKLGIKVSLTQFIIRKLAHFTEYFLFGIMLTVAIRFVRKDLHGTLFFEMFLFLACPAVDETIQMFYKGRTSSVRDVWIDFAGCMVGMGLYRLFLRIFVKR